MLPFVYQERLPLRIRKSAAPVSAEVQAWRWPGSSCGARALAGGEATGAGSPASGPPAVGWKAGARAASATVEPKGEAARTQAVMTSEPIATTAFMESSFGGLAAS